jgi:hypothetical protein
VYTYTSSTAAVATVSATGMVTAVAPGTSTITVTAAGTGTGFTAATMTSAATITVSDRAPGLTTIQVSPATASLGIGGTQQITAAAQGPRASAATLTYGTSAPAIATVSSTGVITAVAAGTATITVTAQSTQDGAFAASSLTGLVTVTVTPAAQVVITALQQVGFQGLGLIDLNNVGGQLTVRMALQPNGQPVTALQVWVCEQGEAVAACATRSGTPAAEQTFAGSAPAVSDVALVFNTAEFAAPNFTTGADAAVNYKNGLKTIVATLRVASGATPAASNTVSAVNFNNTDAWTIAWTQPANRANDAAGNTWLGGPDTPDALLPGSSSGTSSFVVVPVIYTPNRTINSATLNVAGLACGNNIVDRARPFGGRFGDLVRDTTTVSFDCQEAQSLLSGVSPSVVASIDDNSAAGPATVTAPVVGGSIFAPIGSLGQITTGLYFSSNSYRPTTRFMPFDYVAPDIAAFDVRGGGGSTTPDSGWVNGAYAFNDVVNTTTGATRYAVADTGVGLLSSRNTQFSVCNTPSTWSDTSITECPAASAVKNGGLTATVTSMGLGESADLTNVAYFAVARETDRLGNRIESNPRTVTIPAASSPTGAALTVPATPGLAGNTNTQPSTFGVDLVAPASITIPTPAAAALTPTNPGLAGFLYARTGSDWILTTGQNADVNVLGNITATTARFAVRARDERSGFSTCSATSCFTNSGQRLGTFNIERRIRANTPSLTNDALVQNLTNSSSSTGSAIGNVMNGTVVAADPRTLQFQIPVVGEAGRQATIGTSAINTTLYPIAATQAGYYVFTGTIRDRAGNTATLSSQRAAIDNSAPTAGSIALPPVISGGQTLTVGLSGSDDLEVMGADLSIRYPIDGFNTVIRFPRVPNFAATITTGLFHSPFAALTDGKLASWFGNGYTYSGSISFPLRTIHDLQVVDGGNAPTVPAAQIRPNAIGARLYDLRAMATLTTTATTPASWTSLSTALTDATVDAAMVSAPATLKNWNAAGVSQFFGYSSAAAALEFRVLATSSAANNTFPSGVAVISRRLNTTSSSYETEYEYRGMATYAGIDDSGIGRYFRYTFTPAAAVAQGAGILQATVANGDSVRFIGLDAAGNALASAALSVGGAVALTPYTVAAGSNYFATAGQWASGLQTVFATSLQTNTAIGASPIIGTGAGNKVRMYFSQSVQSGFAGSTITYGCTTSNLAAATVAAVAGPVTFNGASGTNFYYCDVTGVAAGSATIQATYYSAASGIFAARGSAAAPLTVTLGTVTVSALPTLTSIAAGAQSAWTTTAGVTTSTFTVTPTYQAGFDAANAPMQYQCYAAAATVVTPSCAVSAVNTATGALTVTLTNSGTAVSGNIIVTGRAVHATAYANPGTLTVPVTVPLGAAITTLTVTPANASMAIGGGVETFTATVTQPAGAAAVVYTWLPVGACTAGTGAVGATPNVLDFTSSVGTPGSCVFEVTATSLGNAVSTPSTLTAQVAVAVSANAIAGSITTGAIAFPRNMSNGAATLAVPLAGTTAVGLSGATPAYTCSSNSALITTAMVMGNCELTAAGVADVAGNPVTITFTATSTGAAAGWVNNTITRTVTVTRIP